jgi:glycerol uptake facilitator protein
MSGVRAAGVRRIKVTVEPSVGQKLAAELLGTGFLTLVGAGAVTATNVLSKGHPTMADIGVVGLAFAIALAVSVYSIGKVSGCHINPAVTIAMLATGRIQPYLAGLYIVAQFAGATLGALGIVAIFGGNAPHLAGNIGVTSFAPVTTSALQAAVAEAIGTFVFLFVIASMAADTRAPTGWAGLVIGLTLGGIIMMMGSVTGASLNPARSFGPALVQSLFHGQTDWGQYWVYVVGPIVGGVLGVFAYDLVAEPKRAGGA